MHRPIVPCQLPLPLSQILGTGPLVGIPAPWVGSSDLDALHRALADRLHRPLALVPSSSRRSLLAWRMDAGILTLRIQRVLALAPAPVLDAVARYVLTRDADAAAIVFDFVRSIPVAPPTPRVGTPRGEVHDLREHVARQARDHLPAAYRGRIGWSRTARGRVRARIRLGSWSRQHELIRVHPALDSAEVPPWVVGFIVFHELLHAELDPEGGGHCARFRAREAAHPDAGRAEAWLRHNVDALLSY